MRILLVEDDTLIGDGIKAGLSKMGFSVDWFTEGRPGKEALYSAPYDAVILDLTLPGMDGRDILRECVGGQSILDRSESSGKSRKP